VPPSANSNGPGAAATLGKKPFSWPTTLSDQVARTAAQLTQTKAREDAETPVNGARNKFLACPCFASDQNGGSVGATLDTKTVPFSARQTVPTISSHMLLIDFFARSDALVLDSLLRLVGFRNEYSR